MQLVKALLNRLRPTPAASALPWSFDPLDPGFLADPYPDYARLRAHAGPYRTSAGTFVLSRYADVVAGLANPLLGNAPSPFAVTHPRNRAKYVCADLANNILPFLDAPQHDLPRRIIAQSFHTELKANPLDLRAIADGCAAALVPGTSDLLATFATPYSHAVICDLMGLPRADAELLRGHSEYFFYLFTRIPSVEIRTEIDRRLTLFRSYFAERLAEHCATRLPGLIGTLARDFADSGGLSDAQLIDTLILLFADAVENVDRGVAMAVAQTLQHTDVLAGLRADPALVGKVVAEALRYESPAQHIARIARDDIEIDGVAIPRDAVVLLMLGAANRDPEVFDAPDRFDVTRPRNPYLSFGKGKHSCIGGTLVRMETEAALTALVARFPTLRLAEPELKFLARPGHRWLAALDVTL